MKKFNYYVKKEVDTYSACYKYVVERYTESGTWDGSGKYFSEKDYDNAFEEASKHAKKLQKLQDKMEKDFNEKCTTIEMTPYQYYRFIKDGNSNLGDVNDEHPFLGSGVVFPYKDEKDNDKTLFIKFIGDKQKALESIKKDIESYK